MENNIGVRPKMPRLQSDLAKSAKRSLKPLTPKQFEKINQKIANIMQPLDDLKLKRYKREERINKRLQSNKEKELKKQEIRMAKQAKREEIEQAVSTLKTLRMELKMIK